MRKLGKSVAIALREPSLGPCFGIKGGAAGGGYAQVIPMADINLHFTGDFHAITTAHNLLAAMLDNHIHQGNELNIDVHSITWKRVMDMNERALRDIVIGLGGKANGVPRQSGFDITTASEIMALLCLSTDRADLERRLASVVVAFNKQGQPVTAKDLQRQRRDGGRPQGRHRPESRPDARSTRPRSCTAAHSATSPTAATRSSRRAWP